MFPHAYLLKVGVEQSLIRKVYKECVRPALEIAYPHAANNWPHSYETEVRRARGNDGFLAYTARHIPAQYQQRFSMELMQRLNTIDECKGAFFYITLRGVKDDYRHNPYSEEERTARLEALRDAFFDADRFQTGEWLVDVAVEIRMPEQSVLHLENKMHSTVSEALDIPDYPALQLVNRTSTEISLTASLTGLAGLRMGIPMGIQRGPFKVSYIQLYQTDKNLLAKAVVKAGKKLATSIDIKKFLTTKYKTADGNPTAFERCQDLLDVYHEAAENQYKSHARTEVRVPFGNKARNVLSGAELSAIAKNCAGLPARTLW